LGCQHDDGEDDGEVKGSEAFPGVRHGRSKILDIGCGNAAALVYLAKEYEFQHLTGIDYSEPGIALAKKVVTKDEATEHIELEVVDLMDLDSLYSRRQSGHSFTFDVLFDKGTFDAICLNEDKAMRDRYVAAIVSMMTPNSYFVITSCNWTQHEVIQIFESYSTIERRQQQHAELAAVHPFTQLKLFKTLKYPEFSFGGRTGSTVATVAFKLHQS
jgi:cyclopropane fatty-acyl-phospholipid synthase-like methyltransferase